MDDELLLHIKNEWGFKKYKAQPSLILEGRRVNEITVDAMMDYFVMSLWRSLLVLAVVLICLQQSHKGAAIDAEVLVVVETCEVAPHSPHDYDDEVQQIPAVPQVGVGVEEQAVGYHLEERLHREDDEEEILHTLLETHVEGRTTISDCVY